MFLLDESNTMQDSNQDVVQQAPSANLKYLFTASFQDGSIYSQTESDISDTIPGKACFTELLDKNKVSPLEIFCLVGDSHTYLVDLRDGHFEIDGVVFWLDTKELPVFNRRLIFFRRHRHEFQSVVEAETNHIVSYRIGWQANETEDETSRNHQFVIEID